RHSVNPGIETLINSSDGQVDPSFAAVMFQKPVMSFSTSAIALALSYAGIGGLSITTALDFWFQRAAAGGTRMTGANSTKFTATKGILCPKSIEADSESHATIDYDMAAVSTDGTTSP